jgi:hypothetical protein
MKNWNFLKKNLKIYLLYNSAILWLDICETENKPTYKRDSYIPIIIVALFTINKIRNQPRWSLSDEWIQIMIFVCICMCVYIYIYILEYHPVIRKEWNYVLCKKFDGPGSDLSCTVSQAETGKHHTISTIVENQKMSP